MNACFAVVIYTLYPLCLCLFLLGFPNDDHHISGFVTYVSNKNIMWDCLQSVNVTPAKEKALVILVYTGNSPDLSTVVRHCL